MQQQGNPGRFWACAMPRQDQVNIKTGRKSQIRWWTWVCVSNRHLKFNILNKWTPHLALQIYSTCSHFCLLSLSHAPNPICWEIQFCLQNISKIWPLRTTPATTTLGRATIVFVLETVISDLTLPSTVLLLPLSSLSTLASPDVPWARQVSCCSLNLLVFE